MTNEDNIKELKQRLAKCAELMDWHGPPARADEDERKEWRKAIEDAQEALKN